MSGAAALLPLVAIALIFWLLVIRPNQRRQQQLRVVQNELAVGDRVLLTSGVFGEVASLGGDTIGLEISPGVVITVARQAVMRPAPEDPAAPADPVDPANPAAPTDGTD